MTATTSRSRRPILVGFLAAAIPLATVAFSPVAGAVPNCPNSTAGSPNKCCVKVGDAPGPGPDCVSSDTMQDNGLLGDLPVVGNLPGLGGIL
jgi:hypothetical protein